jgi:hypothetical protein
MCKSGSNKWCNVQEDLHPASPPPAGSVARQSLGGTATFLGSEARYNNGGALMFSSTTVTVDDGS